MELAWNAVMAPESASESSSDEARLVAAARNGDEDAFADLVRRHQRRVFRLAGRFFRRPEEVEEVAQETFLTAWSKLDSFRAKGSFEGWLTRICLNTCYMRLRKEKPAVELPENLDAPSSGDPDSRLEVERLLATLPPRDRFILLLLHGEEWSVREIAERLGWTRTRVKVRAHRARMRLRRRLEEEPRA